MTAKIFFLTNLLFLGFGIAIGVLATLEAKKGKRRGTSTNKIIKNIGLIKIIIIKKLKKALKRRKR